MLGSSQFSGPAVHGKRKKARFVADNEKATAWSKDNCPAVRDDVEEQSSTESDSFEERKFRKSYCSFLRDVGSKLRMPLVVVATSTVLCHRFFVHQSREQNDQYAIATACIFLAGKVEEARRALEDVVFVSYCLQNKNNLLAAEEFKQKEVCERQKELVILAEHFVLVSLDFNLEVEHPYSYILTATPKYKPASETLNRVSSMIVNDVLYTTLCLQFQPQQIAASALFLAAKLLKYTFPYKDWWKDFNVKLRQLEDISNQILELYEQERAPFSVVHSSCSSSSIDGKASGLRQFTSSTPSQLKSGPQPHLMNNITASQSKSCLTKCSSSRSHSVVL